MLETRKQDEKQINLNKFHKSTPSKIHSFSEKTIQLYIIRDYNDIIKTFLGSNIGGYFVCSIFREMSAQIIAGTLENKVHRASQSRSKQM